MTNLIRASSWTALLLTTFLWPLSTLASGVSNNEWKSLASDLEATSNAGPNNPNINVHNVKNRGFKLKWKYETMDSAEDVRYPYFGDVMFVPAVANVKINGQLKKGVFFPDYAGRLHAVNAEDGTPLWPKINMADAYSDIAKGERFLFSRGTPAVGRIKNHYGKKKTLLVMGSSESLFQGGFLAECDANEQLICRPTDGALMIAVDASDGSLVWRTKLDPHPAAKINTTPIIYNHYGKKIVLVSVSSWEEEFASTSNATQEFPTPDPSATADDPYPCCSFRGSVAALDLKTGKILWQTYTTPKRPHWLEPHEWYSGAASWGLGLSVDKKRHQLYATTGNNYTAPKFAKVCEQRHRNATGYKKKLINKLCGLINDVFGNHVDAVIALDIGSGRINWVFRARNYDPWVHACAEPDFYNGAMQFTLRQSSDSPFLSTFVNIFNVPSANEQNCISSPLAIAPGPASVDLGFARSPMILHNVNVEGSHRQDLLAIGEKSGKFFALNPNTGKVVWKKLAGPYGIIGGFQWGQATDGQRIYAINANGSNRDHPINSPFYPHPNNPFYPGNNPFYTWLDTGVTTGEDYSGPIEIWKVINPPAEAYEAETVDNINTRIRGDGDLETISGMWMALDPRNGDILWQRPHLTGGGGLFDENGGFDPDNRSGSGSVYGTLAVANNVLFSANAYTRDANATADFIALNGKTGEVVWRFLLKPFNQPINDPVAFWPISGRGLLCSSPAIVDNMLYWPSGCSYGNLFRSFNHANMETRNAALYAFELCTQQDVDDGVEGCGTELD